jgi:hypothetical protein
MFLLQTSTIQIGTTPPGVFALKEQSTNNFTRHLAKQIMGLKFPQFHKKLKNRI